MLRHRFNRCYYFLQNSSNSVFLWVLSSCFALHGLFTSSLGSRNVHLTKPLVPLIVSSYDHQNHSKWHKWCHVRYNLPLFGDWWQHNQSKHKICKNWQIEPLTLAWMLTIIQWRFGLPLKPWSPFVPPPICYSSLICWLDPLCISPPLEYFSFLGTSLPLCWEHALLWSTFLPLWNQIT